jgi:hypothetical protein
MTGDKDSANRQRTLAPAPAADAPGALLPTPHLTGPAMRASAVSARACRFDVKREGGSGMRDPGLRRFAPSSGLRAIRDSLFAFAMLTASSALAVECAPYCDYTHDYGPYDLSWKRPGLYAFPRCAPNGECAPRAGHVYSPVSGWPYVDYWPARGVRITVRPRARNR